jgi:hypothetical protein
MDPGSRYRCELAGSLTQGTFDGVGQYADVDWQETRQVQRQVAAVGRKVRASAEMLRTERVGMRDPPL